ARKLEANLADGAIRRKESGHDVVRAALSREGDLRIHSRRGAAVRRERVAAYAAIEVEAWAETVGNVLDLFEVGLPLKEQSRLVRCQARYRIAGGIRCARGPYAGIGGSSVRGGHPRAPTQQREKDRG